MKKLISLILSLILTAPLLHANITEIIYNTKALNKKAPPYFYKS